MPIVTIILIALNMLVFMIGLWPAQAQVPGSTRTVTQHDVWVAEYGAIPCEVWNRCANQRGAAVVDGGMFDPSPRTVEIRVNDHAPWLTLITSAFLHGGLLHLVFNMLFLWVFGNNVEDSMHRLSFIAFYLLGAVVSGLGQSLIDPSSNVPQIGASGAIAAVLGGYLVLYPRARVQTMVFLPFFIFWLPASVVIGAWAIMQLVATWTSVLHPLSASGGVAYMAHVTGFLFGLATITLFGAKRSQHYLDGLDQHEST